MPPAGRVPSSWAPTSTGEYWWELRSYDYYPVLNGPKIIYPDIAKHPRFYLDTEGIYIRNTAYCLGTSDPFLLGVLNSRLTWFAIAQISIPFGSRAGEFRYRLFTQYIEQLPIRPLDLANSEDRALHDALVGLVGQMQPFHDRLATAQTAHDQTVVQRQIDALNSQINRLVYQLYGLSEEETRVLEWLTD